MNIEDRVVVVTGGAGGIGAAMCRAFAADGALAVVVVDRYAAGAELVAEECGGRAEVVDVADSAAVTALVDRTLDAYGRIDIFCSNAGIIDGSGLGADGQGGPFAGLDEWTRSWDVNVMSQVHAARAVLPSMLERGEGYLVNTASAAGLLMDLGSMAYTATKHASVGLSEWLAVSYGDQGIRVSCLCPMGVQTAMVDEAVARNVGKHLTTGLIDAETVADCVVEAIEADRFLILPHPEVAEFFRRKADDPDRWLHGMRRLRRNLYFEE